MFDMRGTSLNSDDMSSLLLIPLWKSMSNSQRKIVAVIDDDPAVLDSMKFLLEVAGYSVSAFSSAMEFLERSTPELTCLILDQHMPQMTGLELVARLRTDGRNIPVLLITGSPSSALTALASRLGIEKVLEKPPTENELFSFIDACK